MGGGMVVYIFLRLFRAKKVPSQPLDMPFFSLLTQVCRVCGEVLPLWLDPAKSVDCVGSFVDVLFA